MAKIDCTTGQIEMVPPTPEEVQQQQTEEALAAANALRDATISSNETTLRDRLRGNYNALRTYEDLASPTNAQTVGIVKSLCRNQRALMRLINRELGTVD